MTATLPEAYERLRERVGPDMATTHNVQLLADGDVSRELWVIAKRGDAPTCVSPFASDEPDVALLAELDALKGAK